MKKMSKTREYAAYNTNLILRSAGINDFSDYFNNNGGQFLTKLAMNVEDPKALADTLTFCTVDMANGNIKFDDRQNKIVKAVVNAENVADVKDLIITSPELINAKENEYKNLGKAIEYAENLEKEESFTMKMAS